MLLRRLRIFGRAYSGRVAQPSLGSGSFPRQNLPDGISLRRGSDQNPLYSLSKEKIIQLKERELSEYLKIPPNDEAQGDTFCMTILDIIHDNILSNPNLAARFLRAAKGTEHQSIIFDSLRQFYKNDLLRWSIVAFIEDPTDRNHRKHVMANLMDILTNSDKPSRKVSLTALNYLKRLALTDVHNPQSLILTGEHSRRLYSSLPAQKRAELFGVMVHINMRFGNGSLYDEMKNYLLKGTQIQRLVARTGFLDVKWHDVLKTDFHEKHKQKMLSFYSIGDIILFVKFQIRRRDVALANLYLDLMVSKFELMGDPSHLQDVLDVMIVHSMTFKSPQECIKFFKYIVDSKLTLNISTLTKVLVELTKQSCYDEALLLVNHLHTEVLSKAQKSYLVREIVKIICGKFAHHPKITIGYYASLFGEKGLQLLQNLNILDVIYGRANSDPSFSFINKADIHEDLRDSELTHLILKDIYSNMLQSLLPAQSTSPVLIKKLYDSYRAQIMENSSDSSSIFHVENMDESIVTIFVEHLLKEKPNEKDSFKLGRDSFRYETAKYIVQDFFSLVEAKRESKKVYLVELLISSSMLQHHDLNFAAGLIKYARDLGLPITFNQIYPFIVFHYSKGAMDQAFEWYSLLVQSGIKSNNPDGDELTRIAKELNWPVKGTYFRQKVRVKNRKARREANKLKEQTTLRQPGLDSQGDPKEGNFVSELGLILSDAAYAKESSKTSNL